jgi:hypothetical protein
MALYMALLQQQHSFTQHRRIHHLIQREKHKSVFHAQRDGYGRRDFNKIKQIG